MGGSADVTAVICTYNRAREVCRAIESVLVQTRAPSQIVVVDDGSTDGTEQALREFRNRIEYVRQANAGASAARNVGIARSRAAWVAFLDSDDEWLEFHLADLLQIVERKEGPAWAFSTRLVRDPGDGPPRPEIPPQIEGFLDARRRGRGLFSRRGLRRALRDLHPDGPARCPAGSRRLRSDSALR